MTGGVRHGGALRVLAIADCRGWAFDRNVGDMARALAGRAEITRWYLEDWKAGGRPPAWDGFDVVYNLHHRSPLAAAGLLPMRRTVGSLRGRWLTPERPGPPGDDECAMVRAHRAFHVVSMAAWRDLAPRCPNVRYLTNPVDVDLFRGPACPPEAGVVAEWNGRAAHDSAGSGHDTKGFREIVARACDLAEVRLVTAEFSTSRLPPEAMPDFYRQANVALCASSQEGASNSVMEAMACGLAVVATDVGNHAELQAWQLARRGDSGIEIVDRSPLAFAAALRRLAGDPGRIRQMGRLNREAVVEAWSWPVWADRYLAFLEEGAA